MTEPTQPSTLVPIEGTSSSCSLVPLKHCNSAKTVWNDLRSSLNICAPQTQSPSTGSDCKAASDAELEEKALDIWSEHDHCETEIAPVLYEICKRRRAPGSKGKGFEGWLRENKKSRSTAYRWIRAYAKREGLPLPYESKPKSLCHVAQTPVTTKNKKLEIEAEYTPHPATLFEAKNALTHFFEVLEKESRCAAAEELIQWIKSTVLTEAAKPEGADAEVSA